SSWAPYPAVALTLARPAAFATNGPSPSQISFGGVAPPVGPFCWKWPSASPSSQRSLCTCDAYFSPGTSPLTWRVTTVLPEGRRTIWAEPSIDRPAPAANGRSAPRVTWALSEDADMADVATSPPIASAD